MISTPFFFQKGLSPADTDLFTDRPLLLSLDFDGTLAPISPTPDEAEMPPKIKNLLPALKRLPQTHLVFLSGRSMPDLKNKIRLAGAIYGDSHGMDISPSAAGWGSEQLKSWVGVSQKLHEKLKLTADRWPGSILEYKGPDLSLHYRKLNLADAKGLITEALSTAQNFPVKCRAGKKVLEFEPWDAPGKAEALKHLADRFLGDNPRGLCVHVGDDQTDENAFRALRLMHRKAFGFKVGEGKTLAHYRLRDLAEVFQLLTLFSKPHQTPRRK